MSFDPQKTTPLVLLLTTFIGAFFGGGATAVGQAWMKEKEITAAREADDLSHQRKARESFLAEQRQELETLYARYDAMLTAADNLAEIGTAAWQRNAYDEEAWAGVMAGRIKIREAYNAEDSAWSASQGRLALFLVDFGPRRGSAEAWIEARDALNGYRNCVERWIERETHQHFAATDPPCAAERKKVAESRDKLTWAAKATRHDAWLAWEARAGHVPPPVEARAIPAGTSDSPGTRR